MLTQIRLRKEYLQRKATEKQKQQIQERKEKIRSYIKSGKALPSELHEDFHKYKATLDLDDDRTANLATNSIDDEYALASCRDSSILITTSRSPSMRMLQFVKEIKLLFPTATRINRGKLKLTELVELCRNHDATDIIVVHESKGIPDGLQISHLPHGPTAYFNLSDVVLRHDLPTKISNMPECAPHLIFHNFSTKLGNRVQNVLKYLFPAPSSGVKRITSFVNFGDLILCRNYVMKNSQKVKDGKIREQDIELEEHGPRFTMRLYRIQLGTLDMKDVEVEWALRSFINKPKPLLHSKES